MKKRLRNLSIATTLTIAVLCEKLVQADLSFQECKNYKIHTRSISLVIDTTKKMQQFNYNYIPILLEIWLFNSGKTMNDAISF